MANVKKGKEGVNDDHLVDEDEGLSGLGLAAEDGDSSDPEMILGVWGTRRLVESNDKRALKREDS